MAVQRPAQSAMKQSRVALEQKRLPKEKLEAALKDIAVDMQKYVDTSRPWSSPAPKNMGSTIGAVARAELLHGRAQAACWRCSQSPVQAKFEKLAPQADQASAEARPRSAPSPQPERPDADRPPARSCAPPRRPPAPATERWRRNARSRRWAPCSPLPRGVRRRGRQTAAARLRCRAARRPRPRAERLVGRWRQRRHRPSLGDRDRLRDACRRARACMATAMRAGPCRRSRARSPSTWPTRRCRAGPVRLAA